MSLFSKGKKAKAVPVPEPQPEPVMQLVTLYIPEELGGGHISFKFDASKTMTRLLNHVVSVLTRKRNLEDVVSDQYALCFWDPTTGSPEAVPNSRTPPRLHMLREEGQREVSKKRGQHSDSEQHSGSDLEEGKDGEEESQEEGEKGQSTLENIVLDSTVCLSFYHNAGPNVPCRLGLIKLALPATFNQTEETDIKFVVKKKSAISRILQRSTAAHRAPSAGSGPSTSTIASTTSSRNLVTDNNNDDTITDEDKHDEVSQPDPPTRKPEHTGSRTEQVRATAHHEEDGLETFLAFECVTDILASVQDTRSNNKKGKKSSAPSETKSSSLSGHARMTKTSCPDIPALLTGHPGVSYAATLDLQAYRKGKVHYTWLKLLENCAGTSVSVPVLIACGAKDGPVVGVVAGIHGNETHGAVMVHCLFGHLKQKVETMSGTVVGVPIANMPAYQQKMRGFLNEGAVQGFDLSSMFPGNRTSGSPGHLYAHALFTKLISKLNTLIEVRSGGVGSATTPSLHTHNLLAHVRADLSDAKVEQIARLVAGSFPILHSHGQPDLALMQQQGQTRRKLDPVFKQETTSTCLRHAAVRSGIAALSIELAGGSAGGSLCGGGWTAGLCSHAFVLKETVEGSAEGSAETAAKFPVQDGESRYAHKEMHSLIVGIHRMLTELRMLQKDPRFDKAHSRAIEKMKKGTLYRSMSWLVCPVGGIAHLHVRLGQLVEAGEPLATICNLFGKPLRTLCSPASGTVLSHVRTPVVESGTPLILLAVPAPSPDWRPSPSPLSHTHPTTSTQTSSLSTHQSGPPQGQKAIPQAEKGIQAPAGQERRDSAEPSYSPSVSRSVLPSHTRFAA